MPKLRLSFVSMKCWILPLPGEQHLWHAELEAALISLRIKTALKVVKGKKLGAQNPKVQMKGAMAMEAKADRQPKSLLKHNKPLHNDGWGAKHITKCLKAKGHAKQINKGKVYKLYETQRVIARLIQLKLLKPW